jgi:hypothetical protein
VNRRWLLATATVQPLNSCKIYLEKKPLIAYYKYIFQYKKVAELQAAAYQQQMQKREDLIQMLKLS